MLDAIVIGGGFGGLSIAALLAQAGLQTEVFEQAARIGGRAASYRDDDGYVWEYGAHSLRLGPKGLAAEVFARLGDEIDFVAAESEAYLIFKGRLWPRPAGVGGFLKTGMLPLTSRLRLVALMLKIKRADPQEWYDRSLHEFYARYFNDARLEEFLPFLGLMIMCPDPHKVSAGEVIQFLQRFFAAGVGVGEPVGGTAQLLDKLAAHVAKNGRIRTGEEVVQILTDAGRAVGILTDEGEYRARRVIFAARLPLLFDLLGPEHFDPGFVDYVRALENSSGLSIDFILDKQVCPRCGGILGVDVPIWARFQSNADDSFTPPGHFISTWGIMLPWHFDGNPAVAADFERKLKTIIAGLIPDFMPHVLKERKLVVPVMNATVLEPSQSLPHRPAVACETVGGLYFVSDTVAARGCSGDISFAAALAAAELIGRET